MKKLIALGILALITAIVASIVYAAFPTRTESVTIDAGNLSASWDDFTFTWNETEDVDVTFTVTNIGSMATFAANFRAVSSASGTTNTTALNLGDSACTVTSNQVTFTVANTNMPDPNTYRAELLLHSGTTSYRTLARGKLNILDSIFE